VFRLEYLNGREICLLPYMDGSDGWPVLVVVEFLYLGGITWIVWFVDSCRVRVGIYSGWWDLVSTAL